VPGWPKNSPGKRVVMSLRLSVKEPEPSTLGRAADIVSHSAALEAITSSFADLTTLLFATAYS